LGFDYGAKRIGVASGQTISRTAAPVATLVASQGSPDWSGIQSLIEQWKPDALIVGIPYHLDGKKSAMTKIVNEFCAALENRFSQPVIKINETLSSQQAEETLKKNTKIGKHNKQEIDKIAAAIIVQSWLDQQ